ncbi:signal peptidase I [Bacillus sp. 1P02SD]|uniref:signal peptidase I n=1 Tax=Bacillus sp. 1P02SD TaxID=3132264 RepID=UPI0039A212C1
MNTKSKTIHIHEIQTENNVKARSTMFSWLRYLLILLFVYFIFHYALGITVISGNSMNPTLHNKDIILTNNIFYEAERNDIVVIQDASGFDIIKRIIALPNETIEIKNGIVFVNGEPIKENFVIGVSTDMPKILVEEGTYFVMGDNRTPGESLDSRSTDFGLISATHIKGEAFFSIKPFNPL